MSQSTRKLLGLVLMLLSLALYAALAIWLYDALLTELPPIVLLLYFCGAGLGWMLPAMAIIRWMSRPGA